MVGISGPYRIRTCDLRLRRLRALRVVPRGYGGHARNAFSAAALAALCGLAGCYQVHGPAIVEDGAAANVVDAGPQSEQRVGEPRNDGSADDVGTLPPACAYASRVPAIGEDPFCPADHDYYAAHTVFEREQLDETCLRWLLCDAPYYTWGECYHCQSWSRSPHYLDP